MKLLLDTHALIWWWNADRRLSKSAADAITEYGGLVSAVAAFELTTKFRLGKLPEADEIVDDFGALIERDNLKLLPLLPRHGLRAGTYRVEHPDPFDRLLAAQAELDDLILVTRDAAFAAFPCRVLW